MWAGTAHGERCHPGHPGLRKQADPLVRAWCVPVFLPRASEGTTFCPPHSGASRINVFFSLSLQLSSCLSSKGRLILLAVGRCVLSLLLLLCCFVAVCPEVVRGVLSLAPVALVSHLARFAGCSRRLGSFSAGFGRRKTG